MTIYIFYRDISMLAIFFKYYQYEQNTGIRLENMKRELEGWKEILLPLNGLINWDKPYHPAIIVGLNTFIFL
jgi:hypothetical protein